MPALPADPAETAEILRTYADEHAYADERDGFRRASAEIEQATGRAAALRAAAVRRRAAAQAAIADADRDAQAAINAINALLDEAALRAA